MKVKTIGIDLAKETFGLRGVDGITGVDADDAKVIGRPHLCFNRREVRNPQAVSASGA